MNDCITQTSANILSVLGLEVPNQMAQAMPQVLKAADQAFNHQHATRVLMYNPDAIGSWIFKKYRRYFADMEKQSSLRLALDSVFPPVTPACFGSMYTGLLPQEHGIQKYEKYTLKVMAVFDQLIAHHKKIAIVSTRNDSISILFLDRAIDYFIYDSVSECNRQAHELIRANQHDVIILYNGNYDYIMHRNSPTGFFARKALQANIKTYLTLLQSIKENWKKERTMTCFAPDHGCHRWLGILGNHGKQIPKDMEVTHFYTFISKERFN